MSWKINKSAGFFVAKYRDTITQDGYTMDYDRLIVKVVDDGDIFPIVIVQHRAYSLAAGGVLLSERIARSTTGEFNNLVPDCQAIQEQGAAYIAG